MPTIWRFAGVTRPTALFQSLDQPAFSPLTGTPSGGRSCSTQELLAAIAGEVFVVRLVEFCAAVSLSVSFG